MPSISRAQHVVIAAHGRPTAAAHSSGITKAYLAFQGADASTSIVDATGKLWTASGDAQLDTAQYKFGSSSLLCDATNDFIYTPSHPDLSFGGGNFTLECFVRFNSAVSGGLIAKRAAVANYSPYVLAVTGGSVYFYASNGSAWSCDLSWSHGANIATGNWYHLAAVRNGSDWRIYLDGVSKASKTVSFTAMSSTVNVTMGGYADGSMSLNGWLGWARITNTARYTANFTPPAALPVLD